MTTTVEAIYEHGKLVFLQPLSLPEKSHVRVTIESNPEREAWLKLSKTSLRQYWTNDAHDVFNELLQKWRGSSDDSVYTFSSPIKSMPPSSLNETVTIPTYGKAMMR